MSITIQSVSATPNTVAPGGQATVTPALTNPDKLATVTLSVDGSSGTGQITVHETPSFSVNPADVGVPGKVVATVDQGGTLAVAPNGTSFIFTAS